MVKSLVPFLGRVQCSTKWSFYGGFFHSVSIWEKSLSHSASQPGDLPGGLKQTSDNFQQEMRMENLIVPREHVLKLIHTTLVKLARICLDSFIDFFATQRFTFCAHRSDLRGYVC